MTKRSRTNDSQPETSADAARRLRTRQGISSSPNEDTTFFFIRLPTGKTVTADLKLSSTVDELLSHLEQKIGHINAPFSVVVGKHLAPRDETLAAAGVSRDCTVQLLLTRVLSPHDYFSQEMDRVKNILHTAEALQQANQHLASGGPLTLVVNWLIPHSEEGSLWPRVLRFKEVDEVATIGQHAAVLCCTLAKHPNAGQDKVLSAVSCLMKLAGWAWQGLQYAAGRFDDLVAHVYHDVPLPPDTFAQLQSSEVLRLVETWLTAVAALMQVTLYTPRLQRQDLDSKRQLDLCFHYLSMVLPTLVDWLSMPMSAAVQEQLHQQLNNDIQSGRRPVLAGQFPEYLRDSRWCSSGQATLLCLMVNADKRLLPPTAALLQGITAMLADHLLSTCQHKLQTLPGLSYMCSHGSVGGHCTAAARDTMEHPAVLAALAHASVLVNPVTLSFLAQHRSQQSGPTAAIAGLQDISWGVGPAVTTVHSVLKTLSASARIRSAYGARCFTTQTTQSTNLIFGGVHRACWDYLPLLSHSLGLIKGFADFAEAQGISQGADRLPEFLRSGGAVLSLMQALLLLGELAGTDDEAGIAVVDEVAAVLQNPIVNRWLDVEVTRSGRLREGTEGVTTSTARLLDLVAWRPQLAATIPTSTRQCWLRDMVFPRRAQLPVDEDDGEVEIEVRRDHLLEDSYAELLSLTPNDLRVGVRVRFKDEDAVGDGVLKEYLVQLASQLFNPFAALFQHGETDRTVMHPSTTATLQPNWQLYCRLAGRVVGLALRHRVPLGIQLSSSFFKALQSAEAAIASPESPRTLTRHLMTATTLSRRTQQQQQQQQGKEAAASVMDDASVMPPLAWRSGFKFVDRPWRAQLTLEDMHQMDPQMSNSLTYLLDVSGAADELHLTFSAAAAGLASAETQRDNTAGRAAATMIAVVADDVAVLDSATESIAGRLAPAAPAPATTAAPPPPSTVVELVPGGASLPVTEANKQQYVDALIEHRLLGNCQEQALWFYVGMCDIAEASALDLAHGRLLLPLTLHDFNHMLCGSHADLNVKEWRASTGIGSSLREEPGQKTVKMFWQAVERLDQIQLRLLLRFWTGITHLPATGFSGLGNKPQIMGLGLPEAAGHQAAAEAAAGDEPAAAEPVAMEAEAIQPGDNTNSAASADGGINGSGSTELPNAAGGGSVERATVLQLPRAHTCFMQLLLPMSYNDANELQEALLIALQNVDYFGRP